MWNLFRALLLTLAIGETLISLRAPRKVLSHTDFVRELFAAVFYVVALYPLFD